MALRVLRGQLSYIESWQGWLDSVFKEHFGVGDDGVSKIAAPVVGCWLLVGGWAFGACTASLSFPPAACVASWSGWTRSLFRFPLAGCVAFLGTRLLIRTGAVLLGFLPAMSPGVVLLSLSFFSFGGVCRVLGTQLLFGLRAEFRWGFPRHVPGGGSPCPFLLSPLRGVSRFGVPTFALPPSPSGLRRTSRASVGKHGYRAGWVPTLFV